MCTANQVEMSCKHVLTHYTQRCEKGRNKPCARPLLRGPRAYLPDCCAECDPEYNTSNIKRKQKVERAKLEEQIYANQRTGHSEEVTRLLERIQKLTSSTNQAIGAVQHPYSSSADVEFPGVTEPKGTSRWVDGKCVWEEEEQRRPFRANQQRLDRTTSAPVIEESQEGYRKASASPRLRTTKKGYVDPPEEVRRGHHKITGPPRLRTNKPYTGPRETVGFVENREPEYQVPDDQHRLRRTKKHTERLGYDDNVTVSRGFNSTTQRHEVSSLDSHRHLRTPRQNYIVDKGEAADEDIWMQLADMNIEGKSSPRRMKSRTTHE